VGELESMKSGQYFDISEDVIRKQASDILERVQPEDIRRLYESTGLRFVEEKYGVLPNTCEIFLRRLDFLKERYPLSMSEKPLSKSREEVIFKTVYEAFNARGISENLWLLENIAEWKRISDRERGYQHNGVLLSHHIETVRDAVQQHPEYSNLEQKDREALLLAALFHDIAKPIGKKGDAPRDFDHGEKSVSVFMKYAHGFGLSDNDIAVVSFLVRYDNFVSDYLRGKLGRTQRELQVLDREAFGNAMKERAIEACANDSESIKRMFRLLRIFNKSDAISALANGSRSSLIEGMQKFSRMDTDYEKFFEDLIGRL